MSDLGEPPIFSAGDGSPSAEPRPRVSNSESATPVSATTAIDTVRGDDDGSGADDFWSDDGEPTPRATPGPNSMLRTLIEWAAVAAGALAVALLIKAFLLQAFYIPSASMHPTLIENDRVLVNKLSYKIGDIERGDIVVFHKPPGAGGDIDDFIKRVIGLEGETVSFADGDVFINGSPLTEPYVNGAITSNGQLIQGCDNAPAVADRCTVPDGMIFVMGDNREHSSDSRVFGPIDADSIVGRAFLKIWPLSDIGFL